MLNVIASQIGIPTPVPVIDFLVVAGGGGGASGVNDFANGGGGGSTGNSGNDGRPGGSGGGAGRSGGGVIGGASVKTAGGLGNAGGDNTSGSNFSGAGGGGSASAGTNASATGTTPVPGGTGTSNSIRTGSGVTYAVGGSGGARSGTYTPGAGTTNTGNGGAGAPAGGTPGSNARNGAAGGAGIVVISYNNALYPAPTYVTGIYGQAISFNNTLSPSDSDPNCYVTYDVSSFGLSSNSGAMSLWLNSGLTYPITSGCNPYYINLQGTTYYSLQTEDNASYRSNISFHTGLVGGNFASTPAPTGWNHYCYVFSNVGATGASNTISYAYLNGTLLGSSNNYSQNFTELRLACQTSGGNGALCSIDDVRLFNTPLTATQVQSIYAALGVPGRGALVNVVGSANTSLTGTPLFSQLSQAARTSAVGAFSLRAVNGSSVKAVQVRNGTTSATQDFYADRLGNLLTAPVTGLPLVDWLGGATGYVATWYDQSGTNHATQATAANQPIIQRATKGPGYMVSFNGTSQFVTLSADSQFLNGTNITVNAVALRTATKASQNFLFGTNTPSANYQRFQFGFGNDTSISMSITSNPPGITIPAYNASNEPVYYMTGGLIPTRVFYQNDTLGGTNVNSGLLSVPTAYSYSIGNGNQGGVYYYQGNLFELLILTSALDQTQVTQVYQNQLSYTGT